MKHFKKLLSVMLAVMLFAGMMTVPSFAASEINVTVNGTPVTWTDAKPFIDSNNRTLVPLRAVADAMGLTVTWEPETRTAGFSKTVEANGKTLERMASFAIDSAYYGLSSSANPWLADMGYDLEMDTSAVIVGGRTYAPIRYLAEAFDYTVDWDGTTKTVQITGPNSYAYIYDVAATPEGGLAIVDMPGLGYDDSIEITTTEAKVDGSSVSVTKLSDAALRSIEKFNNYADSVLFNGYLLTGVSSSKDCYVTWTDATVFKGSNYTNYGECDFTADNGQAW